MIFLKWVFGLFTSGAIDRILNSIDKATDSATERDKARIAALETFARAQVDMTNGPGRWLLALFIVPLGVWFASVIVYSILFCRGCAYPQDWTIAALPAPLDEWAGWIIMSMFAYGAATKVTLFKR